MNKRIILSIFSFLTLFLALQLVGFSYTSAQSFSSIPQENITEEETPHKQYEIKENNKSFSAFRIGDLIKKMWPEQFLKDSIETPPTTPPPRFPLS